MLNAVESLLRSREVLIVGLQEREHIIASRAESKEL